MSFDECWSIFIAQKIEIARIRLRQIIHATIRPRM